MYKYNQNNIYITSIRNTEGRTMQHITIPIRTHVQIFLQFIISKRY